VLVHSVIGEVHTRDVQVVLPRRLVLLGAEPDETLVVQENPERIAARDQGVDPEVELQVVDQERPVDVVLHHGLLVLAVLHGVVHVLGGLQQPDALALAPVVRL